MGRKGIGELPTLEAAAASADGDYHATGKRVRKVPVRIEDVLRNTENPRFERPLRPRGTG